MNEVQLQEYRQLVRLTAAQHGLTIFPRFPFSGQPSRDLWFQGDIEQFVGLAKSAGVRLVYIDERFMDIDADIGGQDQFQGMDEEDDVQQENAVEVYDKAVMPWRIRDGSLYTVFITFVVEGICHRTVEAVDWYEEYEQALIEAGNTLERRNEELVEVRRSVSSGEWRQRIDRLISDPRFALAKNERQRIRLADELNPELPYPASTLVADAMSEIWLREVTEETGT